MVEVGDQGARAGLSKSGGTPVEDLGGRKGLRPMGRHTVSAPKVETKVEATPSKRFVVGKVGRKWGVHDNRNGKFDPRGITESRQFPTERKAQESADYLNGTVVTSEANRQKAWEKAQKPVRSKYHLQTDLGRYVNDPGLAKRASVRARSATARSDGSW